MDPIFSQLANECSALRHLVHRRPELSGQEWNTQTIVVESLHAMGYNTQTYTNQTGVVAIWEGDDPTQCLALRADMDALPLHEESGLAWASENHGVMHACGHDGHLSILLGLAKWLQMGPRYSQSVKLIFQPAEESGNGAASMIGEGVLSNPDVKAIFALHGWPELPLGSIAVPPHAAMAAVDNFTLKLRGQGGHGAMPHLGRDPVVAAAHIISAAQSLISRRIDPLEAAVLTFGHLSAGETFNVIPEECLLRGTMRTLNSNIRKALKIEFENLVHHLAAAMGVKAEMTWIESCPPTTNDSKMAELARLAAEDALGSNALRNIPPSMGGEDFSFFLDKVPGAYFWLGLGMNRGPLHNPRFDFNDAAIASGISVFASIVKRYFAA